MSETAQAANERIDADAEPLDMDFGEGFDAGDTKDTDPGAKPAPEKPTPAPAKPDEKPAEDEKPPEKPTPAQETPPPDNKATPAKPDEKPAEDLSATEKAEAEGAKLSDTPSAGETKSVLDVLAATEGYKDAGDLVKTDAFKTWFDKQPEHIQNLGVNGGVDGACAVIDFFRSAAARTAQAAAETTPAAGAKRLLAELGDMEMVQADGTKVKIQDYLKDMGDLGEAIAVISDRLAGRRMQGVKPAVEPNTVAALQDEVARLRFWEEVSTEHSDARKIVKSAKFKEFAANASPAIKRLIQSGNPAHAVLALDAFKEAEVKAAREADTAKAGKKTAKTVALHSDTARGSTVQAHGKKPDDFDEGFDEGSK